MMLLTIIIRVLVLYLDNELGKTNISYNILTCPDVSNENDANFQNFITFKKKIQTHFTFFFLIFNKIICDVMKLFVFSSENLMVANVQNLKKLKEMSL